MINLLLRMGAGATVRPCVRSMFCLTYTKMLMLRLQEAQSDRACVSMKQ